MIWRRFTFLQLLPQISSLFPLVHINTPATSLAFPSRFLAYTNLPLIFCPLSSNYLHLCPEQLTKRFVRFLDFSFFAEMPSPKEQRRGKVPERSMSFNGRGGATPEESLRRPRTLPDLRSNPMNGGLPVPERKLTPTKVLFHVAIQGSVGNVQVLTSPESTVRDLIDAALKQYVKERRRPVISNFDEHEFDLHYSQFSLESLDREEKLGALGSRNFFMCKRRMEGGCCSNQAEKVKVASPFPWLKSILRAGGGH